ncbi:MAG: Rpn family recombination-promoting nuclease/putative transposase [Candidatus Nucleicultricaceae bacterium]
MIEENESNSVKKKKRLSMALKEDSAQDFVSPTFDATSKYLMSDMGICSSFLRAFVPDENIRKVINLDTHLRPFEEYKNARVFVNADNSKKVVKKINELLDEKQVENDNFSISFVDKNDKKVKTVFGGEEFIKGFASIYGDILRSYPKPHRNSQVDLLCEVDVGYYVLVEMQVIPQDYWDKRALAYAASVYSRQLKEGQRWDEIKKVICINLLGGAYSKKPWPKRTGFSRLTFKDQDNVEIEDGIEVLQYPLYHAELKEEAKKRVSEEGKKEYLEWLDLFENAHNKKEEDIKEIATKEVKMAYDKLKMTKLPKEVKEEYQQQEDEVFKMYSQHTEYLKQEAEKKGVEKGLKEGLEKGKIEIVRNMIEAQFDNSIIHQVTQISEEDIEKVRQEIEQKTNAA